jgi:hypothetical protein
VLGLIVCGALAVAPTAASAATVFADISGKCWLREYPPDTTCDNGWVGAIAIGETSVGQSVSFFSADFNVPTGADVTQATLRFDSPYDMYSQTEIGEAFNLDTANDTWWTYDPSNIATFDTFTPGAAGNNKEVDITAAVQGFLADNKPVVLFGVYAPNAFDDTYLDNLELEIDYDL